jgi:hypothetical protein
LKTIREEKAPTENGSEEIASPSDVLEKFLIPKQAFLLFSAAYP